MNKMKKLNIKEIVKLYGKYASACTQSVMEYKLSFALMLIARFLISFCELISIRFLFSGFTQLGGYTYGDVLLCFSIIQMSFTFAELFGNGFKTFSGMVKRGEFDRMMLRPRSLVFQVAGSRFEVGRTVLCSLPSSRWRWESDTVRSIGIS